MEKENNKALLSDLIALARADDKVTDIEYDFIMRLGNRMQLSEVEVEELFDNPLPSKPLFTELERITHFYKLVLVMNVDNETHEKALHAPPPVQS